MDVRPDICTMGQMVVEEITPLIATRLHRATGWSARQWELEITSTLYRATDWSALGSELGMRE